MTSSRGRLLKGEKRRNKKITAFGHILAVSYGSLSYIQFYEREMGSKLDNMGCGFYHISRLKSSRIIHYKG